MLKHIDRKKYKVTLVLESMVTEELKRLPDDVEVMEYRISTNKNKWIRKISNGIKRIRFFMKNYHRYDFSCSYATYSLPGSVLSKIASRNNSLYIHSNYRQFYNDQEFKYFFDQLQVMTFKTLFFVSNESKNDFLELYPDLSNRVVVCNNFIDEEKIIALANVPLELEKKEKVLFTFVGRLDESSKRLTRLIRLMKYLKEKNFSVECWIVGNGPDYQKYEKMIKKERLTNVVYLLGEQKNPYPYMKKSDYIILTSKYEGFPVVYLESILLGKKIISTIDVSDEDISIQQRFGYIISNHDQKINKEVENILKNDPLKMEELDFKQLNQKKKERLEKIFDQM